MKKTTLLSLVAGLALAAMPALSQAWWNKDWTVRAKLTLNTTAAGAPTKEAVSQVVVPVRLHSGNFDFAAAKVDGSDIRVVAADDKTPLRFAVERFDAVNELALLWVALPTVAPNATTNIHVYGGNEKAAAEPTGQVFDGTTLMAVHFAENDGVATDAAGAIRTQAAVQRQPNGLLGTSARLAGDAIVWPANDKLKFAADATATVALWVKADNTAQGTLLQWGPLKVSMLNGQVVAESGKAKAAGGSLPNGTWAHVAVATGGGRLVVYVNGQQAAEAAVAVPAIEGALTVGGGFSGLVDELQVLSGPRSADWLRIAAASQGADAKFVSGIKETPEEAESGGGESHGYMGILVKNLTVDAWVVIIILAIMFAVAVWVMWTKAVSVGRADRDNRSFLQRFRAATHDLLQLEEEGKYANSSLYRLYRAGVRELVKREVGHGSDVRLSGASIDAVKAAVDADMVRETHRLNDRMVMLTIAISGGPFLGLLGTVVGVMITFAAIAAAGDVNVNAIAPGIAAALLATVAGLGVAIPALFGYNFLASRIKNISADMQIFVDEFVTRVAETYGQR